MTEEQEVIEAVNRINKELEDSYRGDDAYLPELYYLVGPSFMAVEMMIPGQTPIKLWNSEFGGRRYNGKTDRREPMYKYIKRLFRKYRATITQIKM